MEKPPSHPRPFASSRPGDRHPPAPGQPEDAAPRTPAWRRYARLWGPAVSADVDDELRFHVDMRIADYVARGMTEAHATRTALARLGNLDRARRDCLVIGHQRNQRMLRTQIVDAFRQDVRFAIRSLAHRRMWTPIVVLTLALGIGATTAVFSIIDHVLLNPVPYPAADRIVIPMLDMKSSEGFTTGASADAVRAWRGKAASLEGIEAIRAHDVMYTLPGAAPVVLHAAAVTPGFPSFAGERPILGRAFVEADGQRGAEPVVALSESMWRARFGGAADVLGKPLQLDGVTHTIVGVMPSSLRLPARIQASTDIWTALDLTSPNAGGEAIARLRPGVSASAATQELDALLAATGEEDARLFRTRLASLTESVAFKDSLWMFVVASALVLLIVCGNVAHMLLAQGTARERELAVRRAMGAGRGRIVRLLITETLLLGTLGCAAGVLVAWAGLKVLLASRPPSLSHFAGVGIDGRALGIAIALSLLTSLAFGIFASLHALRRPAQEILKAAGTGASASRTHHRLRGLLVVSEIAFSAVLLVGATMLLRTVWNLQRVDPGFEPRGAYAMEIFLHFDKYTTESARVAFFGELLARAKALPGVQDATLAAVAPPGSRGMFGVLEPEDRPFVTRPKSGLINVNHVRPEFFQVLGMRFVEGGTFRDTTAAGSDIVINRTAARVLWPEGAATGRRFRTSAKGAWKRVAGVIEDEASAGFAEPADPMLYTLEDAPVPANLIVRAPATDPTSSLRQLVISMDPLLSAADVSSLQADLARRTARQRFTMTLLVLFSTIAVVLSAIGLYGVMSYAVAQRTREIGVRVALGATQRQIAGGVVSSGLRWTLAGVAVGAVGAWWATRFIESMLFGVTPTDALSFAIGAVMLIAIAILACLVPARRAASVDPLIAMRVD